MAFYVQVIFVLYCFFIIGLTFVQGAFQTKFYGKYKDSATYLYYDSKSFALVSDYFQILMQNTGKLPFVLVVILELEKAIYQIVWDRDIRFYDEVNYKQAKINNY